MNLKRFGFIAFSLLTFSANAQVDQLEINASLNADSIFVGDRVEFSINATGKGKFSMLIPALVDTIPGGFHILGEPFIDSTIKNNDRSYRVKLPVTAFNPGYVSVAKFPVLVKHDGSVDTAWVNTDSLFVKLVPRDTTLNDIKDIKPPIKEPIRFSEVAPWAGLGMLLVAIIALLIMYFRSRKQNKPFLNIFKPKEPAHVIALHELMLLEENKEWASENPKTYYTKLVDILRTYLEGRFDIKAPEQTTSEILSELDRLDFDFSGYIDTFRDILFTSDLVKFAKYTTTIEENHRYLNFAFDFVNGTKPVENSNEGKTQTDVLNKTEKNDTSTSDSN
ncbi:MAG TPA: hypothetical protein ENN49_03290 [Bacteroidales bacterium]|mgnify:CR=1 FL=1|nr:hypothetical protein [Bacteroidales bacterium]